MSSFAKAISEMLNDQNKGNGSQMNGAMIAKVVDNVDPEGRYRIRVSFPLQGKDRNTDPNNPCRLHCSQCQAERRNAQS